MKAQTTAITGATGYLGSHLLRVLSAQGPVVGLARRGPEGNLPVLDEATIISTDDSIPAIAQALREQGVTRIAHLATHFVAEHTPDCIEPLLLSNLEFGTRIAEAASLAGVTQFLNVGSFWQHFEGRAYSPVSLYAATKKAFEDILQYYCEARGMAAITLKLGGVYGPNDPRNKIISLLLRSARESRELLLSPGEQLVDLIYVDDAVRALEVALAQLVSTPSGGQVSFSVSSGRLISLQGLVAAFEESTKLTVPVRWGGRPYRAREFFKDWRFDSPLPGWSPSISLQEGLKRVSC